MKDIDKYIRTDEDGKEYLYIQRKGELKVFKEVGGNAVLNIIAEAKKRKC